MAYLELEAEKEPPRRPGTNDEEDEDEAEVEAVVDREPLPGKSGLPMSTEGPARRMNGGGRGEGVDCVGARVELRQDAQLSAVKASDLHAVPQLGARCERARDRGRRTDGQRRNPRSFIRPGGISWVGSKKTEQRDRVLQMTSPAFD